MFTSIAFSLFNTLESIAIPCSVKAKGIYRKPPLFEVTICDLKLLNSISVNSNIKSSGNLFTLRLTDCLKTYFSTLYNNAKSKSRITLQPRFSNILF